MKNLLIAFLLAIFSFQGAVAAIGEDMAAANPYDREQAQVLDRLLDHADERDDAEEAQISSSIEELSDYVLLQVPVTYALYPVPNPSLLYVHILSIDLPTLKPPPRG